MAAEGLVLNWPASAAPARPESFPMPSLPALLCRDNLKCKDLRAGFTLEVRFRLDRLDAGQALLDNLTEEGNGFRLQTCDNGALELVLCDGRSESRWKCDPELVGTNRDHHAVVIVDGGPKLILFVVDGVLCDGGEQRQFGWGRYNPSLRSAQGAPNLRIGGNFQGNISLARIYNRALRVSEAIGNWRSI